MSEQQLRDFAEAAERRVAVPDLVDLTGRGRDLRRVRRAAAAGALALVVAVGGVLSSVARDDRSSPPAVDPTPSPDARAGELRARGAGGTDLVAGQEHVVRLWQLSGRDDIEARFRVPGRHWVWRSDLATRSVGGLSVWVLDVEGTRVVVWSELSPGLPATYGAPSRALLDSITLRREPQ